MRKRRLEQVMGALPVALAIPDERCETVDTGVAGGRGAQEFDVALERDRREVRVETGEDLVDPRLGIQRVEAQGERRITFLQSVANAAAEDGADADYRNGAP